MTDWRTLSLVGGVLLLLGAATGLIQFLKRRLDVSVDPAIVETFRLRVRAWWILFSVLVVAFFVPTWVTVLLFMIISFWVLREFITLTPTRPSDHRTLFFVFFVFTPLQYALVGVKYYGLYSVVIPVYAFLIIPAAVALAGDTKRFLERTAKIQVGLLICVYCLSYTPALLTLRPTPSQNAATEHEGDIAAEAAGKDLSPPEDNLLDAGGRKRLLFFFVLIVQLSDAMQYLWAQIPRRHVIVPSINPSRTWEGLLGGTATVTLLGAVLWWATPFRGADWWMAGVMSGIISLMCFAGGLTMSAIKRDRGVKDYGTLVTGHGGLLDRIDSICFAAPVFFHCTRWWLVLNGYIQPIP
ncbi:MAG: phosphatidate cytidylyltransferase [Pirellulales bacterium]|nr:phosphatidate cytidylyltransferase [Pirellulales bacterium]